MNTKAQAKPPEEMPKVYDHHQVEERWYQSWLEKCYFTPQIDHQRRPFVVIMPPPNVTGELHLGHALTATLEDVMVRWHRMRGEPTLWLPGIDHAGIAGQNVVEQQLATEGLTRHQLGRERFLERVWEWMHRYGRIIAEQHKRLGASCDWTRERFTMAPGPSKAVRTTFVNLYEKGLIYRGERLINWCPRCSTALSDLEVEHQDILGNLYYVRYPLHGSDEEYVTVATTRPETILGDTAVAVHPEDERYRHLVGRQAVLPVLKRIIPIIADYAVDPHFGTGAVKITPAHDPLDFEVGQRHGLPAVLILTPEASMNEAAGPYVGMDRYACREALVADLEREGLLLRVDPHVHAVGHCSRCKTVVEPLISKQWFLEVKPLAQPAIRAVLDGHIRIVPERFTKIYLSWMENIRDWCLSRQLWWGHRIPAWYCLDCDGHQVEIELREALCDPHGQLWQRGTFAALRAAGLAPTALLPRINLVSVGLAAQPIVSHEDVTRCPRCGGTTLLQDPDVLDTWFSSALWPHSTLGWPDDTADLAYFYPTTVMETGYDILFFWVARMIMMGLENTGKIPFEVVYLHGLVRDEKGEKMSKSRGNVINPIEAVEEFGADALRLTLCSGSTPGNDMKLSLARLAGTRNFANKLWNASRFVITVGSPPGGLEKTPPRDQLPLADRWILSRLHGSIGRVTSYMEAFQFGEAQRELHEFLWREYCDWYIEMAKIRLRHHARDTSPLPLLVYVLETSLRLLHPFMPFITEEIWQRLMLRFGSNHGTESIMIAPYPEADEAALDLKAEWQMALIMDIVRAIRNARAEHRVAPSHWVEAILVAEEACGLLESQAAVISTLARVRPLSIVSRLDEKPQKALSLLAEDVEIYLPLAGMMDLATERRRLEQEREAVYRELVRAQGKLADPDFVAKAPAEVVARERERLQAAQQKLDKIHERLA